MGLGEMHLAPIKRSLLRFLVIWFAFSSHFSARIIGRPHFLHVETETPRGNTSPKATWFVDGTIRSQILAFGLWIFLAQPLPFLAINMVY